jgi:hypothetical protein
MSRPIWSPARGLCRCRHSELDHQDERGRCLRWRGAGVKASPCACEAYEEVAVVIPNQGRQHKERRHE